MAKSSGGGGRSGGRGGGNKAAQVAVSSFGGRTNADGSITLSGGRVEDAIGFSVRRRRSGSVERASIGGQTISASSVSSIQRSINAIRLTENTLTVRRVSGQAYVGRIYRDGIEKIASKLGPNITTNWTD